MEHEMEDKILKRIELLEVQVANLNRALEPQLKLGNSTIKHAPPAPSMKMQKFGSTTVAYKPLSRDPQVRK